MNILIHYKDYNEKNEEIYNLLVGHIIKLSTITITILYKLSTITQLDVSD